jgi:hypothetical protein
MMTLNQKSLAFLPFALGLLLSFTGTTNAGMIILAP